MKKTWIALGVFALMALQSKAQSDVDALRYSMQGVGGTARTLGMGGAFSSVGADFGSLDINPAGVGLFRSNEFSFTPEVNSINANSTFQGNSETDRRLNFDVANWGIEWAKKLRSGRNGGWQSVNFAIGGTRLNNFNNNTFFSGNDNQSSLIDYYVSQINASPVVPSQLPNVYPFDGSLLYNTGLIYTNSADSLTYNDGLPAGTDLQRAVTIQTSGGQDEYYAALGTNYLNKLYLGVSLGVPTIRYNYASTITETDINNELIGFDNYSFTQAYTTTGVGINAKVGLIYKVNDYLRLGAAVHSPTYYWLQDSYSNSVTSNLESYGIFTDVSPNGSYNYNLTTPWRLEAGATVLIKTYGLISADYEYVNYGSSNYSFNETGTPDEKNQENALNNTISDKYGASSNLRVGGELALGNIRLRLGYTLSGSPFKDSTGTMGFDESSHSYSGGIGIRFGKYYLDGAYVYGTTKQFYQPYSLSYTTVPGANITTNTSNILATIGVKF